MPGTFISDQLKLTSLTTLSGSAKWIPTASSLLVGTLPKPQLPKIKANILTGVILSLLRENTTNTVLSLSSKIMTICQWMITLARLRLTLTPLFLQEDQLNGTSWNIIGNLQEKFSLILNMSPTNWEKLRQYWFIIWYNIYEYLFIDSILSLSNLI